MNYEDEETVVLPGLGPVTTEGSRPMINNADVQEIDYLLNVSVRGPADMSSKDLSEALQAMISKLPGVVGVFEQNWVRVKSG